MRIGITSGGVSLMGASLRIAVHHGFTPLVGAILPWQMSGYFAVVEMTVEIEMIVERSAY